jgi:hypothetical protein
VWKKCAVCDAGVAEEMVDRVEKSCQSASIKARGEAALGETFPESDVALTLGRPFRVASAAKDPEIAPVHEGKSQE